MLFTLLTALLLIINFTVSNSLLFTFRIDIAGFPLNVLDALMMVLGVVALLASRDQAEADRVHPLLPWSIGLLILAAIFGVVGGIMSGTPLRAYITSIRNLLSLPLAIYIGYRFVRTPSSTKTAVYLWLCCSLASALAMLFLVRGTSEEVAEGGKGLDELRAIHYGGDAGMLAMSLLAFTLVARVRLLPRGWTVPLMLISTAGCFGAPHRGTYVMGALLLLFSTLVLPKVPLGRRLGMTLVGLILVSSTLLAGTAVVSRLTGRDFSQYVVERRLKQLLPWYNEQTGTTVTGTRLPGILLELKIWSQSPVFGKGFGIQERAEAEMGEAVGSNHNVWTSALAQSGLPGMLGYLVPSVGCLVVGYRMWRDQTERNMAIFGVLAAIGGMMTVLWASLSMSINQQRPALLVGLLMGMAFRARALQQTMARQYAGYLDEGEMVDASEGYWHDPADGYAAGHGGSVTI